jgi:hypothetical protein
MRRKLVCSRCRRVVSVRQSTANSSHAWTNCNGCWYSVHDLAVHSSLRLTVPRTGRDGQDAIQAPSFPQTGQGRAGKCARYTGWRDPFRIVAPRWPTIRRAPLLTWFVLRLTLGRHMLLTGIGRWRARVPVRWSSLDRVCAMVGCRALRCPVWLPLHPSIRYYYGRSPLILEGLPLLFFLSQLSYNRGPHFGLTTKVTTPASSTQKKTTFTLLIPLYLVCVLPSCM